MNLRKMMLSDKRELMGKISTKYANDGMTQLTPLGNSIYCSIILKLETVEKLRDLCVLESNRRTFDQVISDLIRKNRS